MELKTDLPPAPNPEPAPEPRRDRREPTMILIAIGISGMTTLGLLSARGGAAPTATAPASGTAAPGATSRATPASVQQPVQHWSAENSAAWTGDRRGGVAFELPAENTIAIWTRQTRPVLVVRCVAKTPEAFVFTDSAAKLEANTEDHTVTFGFDGGGARTERWPDSSSHDALFAPQGEAFVRELMAARTFTFGFTPHNAAPATAHFNVAGLQTLLEPVAKECGWKP